MELGVKNLISGSDLPNKIDVLDHVVNCPFNKELVHSVLVSYLAGGRSGSSCQKTRAEVSGSGKKPWRQKGTGRARAGCLRSPIWRSGGITFASKPRNYDKKVNRKEYQGAMRSIFSELVRNERFFLFDILPVYNKTKDLVNGIGKIIDLKTAKKIYMIVDSYDDNFYLASRNIKNLEVSEFCTINPISLIDSDAVICNVSALKNIEKWLG